MTSARLVLASEVELGLAVGSHGTPLGLVTSGTRVTDSVGLPGLVEGLEVEGVDAPLERTADSLVVVSLGKISASLRVLVVRAAYA